MVQLTGAGHGAGIAGVLLASKLAATGKKVLMLNQGPRFSENDRTAYAVGLNGFQPISALLEFA